MIARAGAGVNNIPLDKCAEQGIVVFNTPGANANGVKELVIAGMLLAARDIVGGIDWVRVQKTERRSGRKWLRKRRRSLQDAELLGKEAGCHRTWCDRCSGGKRSSSILVWKYMDMIRTFL